MTPPLVHLLVRNLAVVATAAPEDVWILGQPGSHPGYRVRYRVAGERRWSSVLLVGHDHYPTHLEIAGAIEFYRFGELEVSS